MNRRDLIALGVSTAALSLSACSTETPPCNEAQTSKTPQKKIKWNLVTSWPKNFPGLGKAPERLANMVNKMTEGNFEIKVFGAGELAPALEVFNTVSQGSAQAGHSAAYYWKGKMPASPFFTTVPFGLNAQEMNAWVYENQAINLWRKLYQPYGVIPFPGGNTGVQMAGWFNKEIHSLDDIKGLTMRIPGLAGEAFKQAGGVPVTLPGAELFTALQTGAIDATEWVGPYNDLAFGLYQAAKYYYGPGWHEPGPMLEFVVNQSAFEQLPKNYQVIFEEACRATNQSMLDEYTANNQAALQTLVTKHKVQLRTLPKDVLTELKKISDQILVDVSLTSPLAKEIYQSYIDFKNQVAAYHELTERAYYSTRNMA